MSSLSSLLHVHSALECRRFGSASYDIYAWSLAVCLGVHTLKYPKEDGVQKESPLSTEKILSMTAKDFCNMVKERLDVLPESRPVSEAFSLLWGGLDDGLSFNRLLQIWTELDCGGLLDAVDYLSHEFIDKFYPGVQTPQWLNRLAVLLVAPIKGSFYDGTAGIGDTAFEALQYAGRNGGSLSVHTKELDNLFFSISLLRTHLKAVDMQQRNDDCFQQKPRNSFDYSVMFPPVGEPGRTNRSSDAKDDNKDWRFALHLLTSLSEHGQGVCCVFSGALFNARSSQIRKKLLEQNVIDAIISFPANTLSYTAVPISLVVFRKGREANESVCLIDTSALLNNNSVTNPDFSEQINRIYRAGAPVSGIAQHISPKELTGKNLLPAAYLEKEHIAVHTDTWGELHILSTTPNNWISMEHIAQIYTGINSNLIASDGDGYPARLIRLSDVQSDMLQPDMSLSYLRSSTMYRAASSQVHVWDILVSSKGSAIKLCLISPEDIEDSNYPLYMSQNFLGIRVNQDYFNPNYIYLFLKSPVGLAALSQWQIGSSIPILRKKDLEQIRLPYLPLSMQEKYIYELQQKEISIQAQIESLARQKKQAYIDFYNQIGLKPVIKEELW